MYMNGQTLRHKDTNKLIKLAISGDSSFAWNISDKTAMYDEDGKPFVDDISNYTHIENEFGQAACGGYSKDNKPDLSLKKYVGVDLTAMRETSLLAWETKLLAEMDKTNIILCPFANGSQCPLFKQFFLERRKAVPLYQEWNRYEKHNNTTPVESFNTSVWNDGPPTFVYKDQQWLYCHIYGLFVIRNIKLPQEVKNEN